MIFFVYSIFILTKLYNAWKKKEAKHNENIALTNLEYVMRRKKYAKL